MISNPNRPAPSRDRLATTVLTDAALIALDYIPPPEALAPFVTTFFLMRCEEPVIADIQPAGVGLLAFFMRGAGSIFFRDGTIDRSHRANLVTPLAAAAPVLVDGPWHTFGAALSPLGWAALTGLSASTSGNRLREAGEILGPAFTALGDEFSARWAAGTIDVPDMIAATAATIEQALRPVPTAQVQLMAAVAEWLGSSLSPEVDLLAARTGHSPRQLQRLVNHGFGLPPKALARKYRALRAAALLADPTTTSDRADAAADAFYDQPHMIREIRLFVGRTPSRLGGGEAPLNSQLINLRNFREVSPPQHAVAERADSA